MIGGDLSNRLRAAGDGIAAAPPRFERVVARAHRRMVVSLLVVLGAAVVAACGLLVAGALGRSLRDPNFRVPGVDTRAAPCTGSILADVPAGRRLARLPAVLGEAPAEVARRLRAAGLEVAPYAETSGRCAAVSVTPPLPAGAALTRETPVIIRFRPA